jgi:hypothetical protein
MITAIDGKTCLSQPGYFEIKQGGQGKSRLHSGRNQRPFSSAFSRDDGMTGTTSKPVLITGVQPTGRLTIGNYTGVIRNWKKLCEQYDCLLFLADLHATSLRQNLKELSRRCYESAAMFSKFQGRISHAWGIGFEAFGIRRKKCQNPIITPKAISH